MTKRIGYDCDGVLFDFDSAFVQLARQLFDVKCPDVSTTWPREWDYLDPYLTRRQVRQLWDTIVKSKHFWVNLGIYPWTHQMVTLLNSLDAEIYFITSRAGNRVKQQCEDALKDIGFDNPTVLISPRAEDKIPLAQGLHLTHFVDDKVSTLDALVQETNAKVGMWVMPWNENEQPMGTYRLADLDSLRKFFS